MTRVRAHTRRTKSGRTAQVRQYERRTKNKSPLSEMRMNRAISALRKWKELGLHYNQANSSFQVFNLRNLLGKIVQSAIYNRPILKPGLVIGAWRGTNRRKEYDDVISGKDIISINHIDDSKEAGMSVSEEMIYLGGYKYAYKVKGTVVDYGSDSEPVLRNVKVLSNLMKPQEAIDTIYKEDEGERRRRIMRLVRLSGVSLFDILSYASYFTGAGP